MRAQQLICVTCCRSAEVGGGGLKETPWAGRNAENILDLKRQHN